MDTSVLQQLDAEARELLDTIDSLRHLRVDAYVQLPQIIVVGDQSSGKSSVLEAISRVKFPSKNGVCTRFATELSLRTAPNPQVRVRIVHPDSQGGGHGGKGGVDEPLASLGGDELMADDLPRVIEEAKELMGLGANGNSYSQSVLRVEIHGPEMPQLTLVDLPGFYHGETADQTGEGRGVVEEIAAKYMAQESSIILAVVSAKSEIAGQIVLRRAKEYDPNRERTLGVITKPDTLEVGSSEEADYLQLTRNEEPYNQLKLGWHVLLNRKEVESQSSSIERDHNEAEFLSKGRWRGLPAANKGVAELRSKLSGVLLDHIKQNLPNVIGGIESNIRERRMRLDRLGSPRSSPGQHRVYLGGIAQRFERLAHDAIRGIYTDDAFFGQPGGNTAQQPNYKKLRAFLRQLNRSFAVVLAEKGSARLIRTGSGTAPKVFTTRVPDISQLPKDLYAFPQPAEVSWDAFRAELELDAVADQGTEFPGSRNPWLAFKHFKKLSSSWKGIAARHIELCILLARHFVEQLLRHVVPDNHTLAMIWSEITEPFFEEQKKVVDEKLEELLEHYRGDYASQIDFEFMSRLSKRAADRAAHRALSTHREGAVRPSEFDTDGVIDSMLTYYEMSLETFTENVLILAVENCLVRKIPRIFESSRVGMMDDEELELLAAETRAVRDQREILSRELDTLERGLSECKRYRRPREMGGARRPRAAMPRSPSTALNGPFAHTEKESPPPQPQLTGESGGGMFEKPELSGAAPILSKRAHRRSHAARESTPPPSASASPSSADVESPRRSASPPLTPPSLAARKSGQSDTMGSKGLASQPGTSSTRLQQTSGALSNDDHDDSFNEAEIL